MVGREAGTTGVVVDARKTEVVVNAGMLVGSTESTGPTMDAVIMEAGTVEDAPRADEAGGVPSASSAQSIFLTKEPKYVTAAGVREGEEDVVVVVVPELVVLGARLVPQEVVLVHIAIVILS
uniref:Uncharacterized protein n=1 Tax=Amphimedon queenslandica TaxID=400682 RepID=A0A1X7UPX0_AMPQE